MTDNEIKELAERLAKVACDFFHYGFDPDNPKHQRKLSEWMLPELEKANLSKPKSKLKDVFKLSSNEEWEEICPHHVPCVVCPTPHYRKKRND